MKTQKIPIKALALLAAFIIVLGSMIPLKGQEKGIEYQLELSKIICTGDSAKATLTYLNGTPPMRVVIKKDHSFQAYIDTLFRVGQQLTVPYLLEAGDYTLFMTDAAPDTLRYTFVIAQPEQLEVVVVSKEEVSCNDRNGALVHLLPKGILPNEDYSLQWSSGHTTEIVENLSPGPYEVTLTNSFDCTASTAFEVNGIPPIDIEVVNKIHPSCPGKEDGAIRIDVEGGVGIQYFYEWSDPDLPKRWFVEQLSGGLYELKVFDISGCVDSIEIPLIVPPPIEPEIIETPPTCANFEDGSIHLSANEDGALPFYYSLNGATPKTGTKYSNLPAGIYDLEITDSRGCTVSKNIALEAPEPFDLDLGEDRTFLIGESKPLVISQQRTDKSYQFEWFPSESLSCSDCANPIATPLQTTTYTAIVTDENGCFQEEEITISIDLDRPVFFPTAFSPNGDGYNDFFEIPPGKTTTAILRLQIFNRWGQLLYDSQIDKDPAIRWDGNFGNRPANKGVYIFAAEILFADGEVLQFHGDVLLLR